MKEIKLNKGFVTQVDDEDFEWLNQLHWFVTNGRNTHYVQAWPSRKLGKRKVIHMHRLIMNTPIYMQVDHIDHNGLNNQKNNLRNCTHGENQHNRKLTYGIKFKGVKFREKRENQIHPYETNIRVDNKSIFVGSFSTEIEAALAYDNAAKKYFGEFAYLNFKDNPDTKLGRVKVNYKDIQKLLNEPGK